VPDNNGKDAWACIQFNMLSKLIIVLLKKTYYNAEADLHCFQTFGGVRPAELKIG